MLKNKMCESSEVYSQRRTLQEIFYIHTNLVLKQLKLLHKLSKGVVQNLYK